MGDGHFIVGWEILEDPAHAKHIPFLATLPRCRLTEAVSTVQSAGSVGEIVTQIIKPGSVEAADPRVIDRSYTHADAANPYSDPPLPDAGDWSEAALYEATGRALSKWETFETVFADLFTAFLGPMIDTTAAARAYGSVIAFSGRLNMVRAAAETYFAYSPDYHPDPLKKAWLKEQFRQTSKRAETLSKFRNHIAHGVVGEYSSPAGHVRGVALMPARYAFKRRKLMPEMMRGTTKPEYAYTSGIVSYLGNLFAQMVGPTGTLSYDIYQFIRYEPGG
jgi:hypothetical protein